MKTYSLSGALSQIEIIGSARWVESAWIDQDKGHFFITNKHRSGDLISLYDFNSDYLYIVCTLCDDDSPTIYDIDFYDNLIAYFAVREGSFFYICDVPLKKMNHIVLRDLLGNNELTVKQALEFMEL